MQYTNKYNMQKPDYSDDCDVIILNSNFDIIDTQIERLDTEIKKKPDESELPYRVYNGEFQYKVDGEWKSIVTSTIKSIQRVVAVGVRGALVDENGVKMMIIPIAQVNPNKTVVHIHGGYSSTSTSSGMMQVGAMFGGITEDTVVIKESMVGFYNSHFSLQIVEYY